MKETKPLTLKRLKKMYKMAQELQPQPPSKMIVYDGWLLNLKFPFVHRIKKVYFKWNTY